MARTSSHYSGVQESEQDGELKIGQILTGVPPRTNDFDPELCELEIIRKRYSWYVACDMSGGGPHPGLSAPCSVLVQRNTLMPPANLLTVAYLVGIKNKKTKELWNCVINNDRNQTNLHINGGIFKIEAVTDPPTWVTSSNINIDGKPLRQHEGIISIFMAVDQIYMCTISLMDDAGNELSTLRIEERAMSGFQLAAGDFPLAKTRLEGVEGSTFGRKVIHHFQDLVNNGLYNQFRQDFDSLKDFVDRKPKYQDLIPSIMLEECVIDLVQSNWNKCEEKANEAIAKARQMHSVNINILLATMKSRIGTVRRLKSDLKGAWELMNEANELLFFVAPCEAVAEFFHNLFSLYADDRTTSSDVTRQGYDEAETCYRLAQHNWQEYCESFPMICSQLDFEVRAAVRLMNFYLQTSRDSAPSLDGRQSAVDVARAEEVARQIERKPLADCHRRVIAGYYLTKTDILLLRGNYNEAIDVVRTSLRISRRLGLKKCYVICRGVT